MDLKGNNTNFFSEEKDEFVFDKSSMVSIDYDIMKLMHKCTESKIKLLIYIKKKVCLVFLFEIFL